MNRYHTNQPLISVIIPTQNCLDLLPAALDSVDAQGMEAMEILVVDDGSTDGTWEWLEQRQRRDHRLKPLRLSGMGPARARNYAIGEACGRFVAFLDADDIWYQDKLRSQIAFHVSHPEVVMSFTNYRHVDTVGTDLGDCFGYWPAFRKLAEYSDGFNKLKQPLSTLFAENVVGTSCVMVSRDALHNANGFDESLHSATDWEMWLRLAASGQVAFSGQVLCDYLMRPNSVTSNSTARLDAMEQIIHRHRAAVHRIQPAAVKQAQSRLLVGQAETYRASGQRRRALTAHLHAFTLAPNWRTLRSALADGYNLLARTPTGG